MLPEISRSMLKNALVHGSAHHPVFVVAHVREGRFTLRVTNGGPDLSPAVIAQLLKPYWRAASRAGSEGLGLGLYIVDQIARGHGGTIDIGSSAGSTSFTFTMPAEARA